jgi:hydroxyacylglutathione hydrolase
MTHQFALMLDVYLVPCLSDNYGFLVHDPASGETVSIDSPDGGAILAEARTLGLTITQIWNTHHHRDHIGGNAQIVAATGAKVAAPLLDAHRISGIDLPVGEGSQLALGAHMAEVWQTPGHTTGHVCYLFRDQRLAFVGDTLFAMGCGRLFEGTPDMMWKSLDRFLELPRETAIYCAHEYTLSNGRFALSVDPDNDDLNRRMAEVIATRERGEPTVPTTLGLERATNPFLRPHDPDLRRHLGFDDRSRDAEVFAKLRALKDVF